MKSGPYDLVIVHEIQNNFYIIQKNIKAAVIFSATFSLCSIVISGQNSHDTASKHYGGGGQFICFWQGILHNFTM